MKQKKSLGQHFLHSPKIIGDIIRAGSVTKKDTVLEIGPGEGTLTSALLKTGAKVVAVEKDDRLIPVLQEKFKKEINSKQLTLLHADILDLDMSRRHLDIKKYKVVANIPYYITGQIIRTFLESKNQPQSMTLLVQKEVAERIVARPARPNGHSGGNKKESLLSLSVKVYGTPKYIRTVGRGAFSPPPSVDSAVLCIENISKSNFSTIGVEKLSEEKFFEVLHAGFAHKRKQLLSNLNNMKLPKGLRTRSVCKLELIKAFDQCGIDLKARAENLSIDKWFELCGSLTSTE